MLTFKELKPGDVCWAVRKARPYYPLAYFSIARKKNGKIECHLGKLNPEDFRIFTDKALAEEHRLACLEVYHRALQGKIHE